METIQIACTVLLVIGVVFYVGLFTYAIMSEELSKRKNK
jgi:hypothetical protein